MTVVFICPKILRDAHRETFAIDKLLEEGYRVIILDATRYYGNIATATDEVILNHRVQCGRLEDFKAFKLSLPQDPVLYVCFDRFMKFAAPILELLIRKDDKLLVYHTKRFSSIHLSSNKIRQFLHNSIIHLDGVIPRGLFRRFYRKVHKVYVPDYFLCSTSFLIPVKVLLTIPKENRIIVHADDLNKTLTNNNNRSFVAEGSRVGVFLDQVIPYQDILHPSLVRKKIPESFKRQYYTSLRHSLKHIQQEMELDEVIVALHPDAKRFEEEISSFFKGFKTVIGATQVLIKESSVVIGHSSTALGYAIYYNKPVIILWNNNFQDELVEKYIQFFKRELGVYCVDMNAIENFSPDKVRIDTVLYSNYITKYLKDTLIEENSYLYAIKEIQKKMFKI